MKEHGLFLTIMVVLGVIGSFLSLYSYFLGQNASLSYQLLPNWFSLYIVFSSLLGLLSSVGIWLWKKWAVYVLVAWFAIGFLVQLYVFNVQNPGGVSVVGYLVGSVISVAVVSGLWLFAIHRKWENFA